MLDIRQLAKAAAALQIHVFEDGWLNLCNVEASYGEGPLLKPKSKARDCLLKIFCDYKLPLTFFAVRSDICCCCWLAVLLFADFCRN